MPQPMDNPQRSRRSPRALASIAMALLAFGAHAVPALAEDEAAFLKDSVAFFEQQTKANLPLQVDQVTRLEQIRLDPDSKVLHYHYGLSNMSAASSDAAALDKFRSEQRAHLEQTSCQQPALLERLRQHGIRIANDYDGSDGKPLASVEVDPQSLNCKQG